MTVSLCIIAKNEAANLGPCLEGVAELVDEVVVVDTGSSDATKEVARELGARVADFPWCDSFAAARNESIRLASGDWIFWLDADDRVPEHSRIKLRALFAALPDENVGYLMNVIAAGPDAMPASEHVHVRLFRNDPRIRWEMRVHEQIAPSVARTGGRLKPTGIAIVHVGYANQDVTESKLERNLRLADLDCEEMPLHPAALYGRATTLVGLGRGSEALVALHLCEGQANDDLVRRVLPSLKAHAYVLEDGLVDALGVVRDALAREPTDARLLFLEARLLAAVGDLDAAAVCARAQLAVGGDHFLFGVFDHSLGEYRVRHLLSEVLLLQGNLEAAIEEASIVIARRPMFGGAWLTMGDALVRSARTADLAEHCARLAQIPGTGLVIQLIEAARLSFTGAHDEAAALVPEPPTTGLADAPRLRARAQILHASGAPREVVSRAVRSALVLDRMCMRSRAIERRLSAESGMHGLSARGWHERAASAVGPLVRRDG